jgi:hypothetical protein
VAVDRIVPDLCLLDKSSSKIDFNDLEIKGILGSGTFGAISEANYNGKIVAVKQINVTSTEQMVEAFRDWKHEVCIMEHLHTKI